MNYQELRLKFTTAILQGTLSQLPPWDVEIATLEKIIALGKTFADLYYLEECQPNSDGVNYLYSTSSM